jgi:hypothetical protein
VVSCVLDELHANSVMPNVSINRVFFFMAN